MNPITSASAVKSLWPQQYLSVKRSPKHVVSPVQLINEYETIIVIYQLYRNVCDEKRSNFKWVTFSTWPKIPFCHDMDSWHWQSPITFQPVCTFIGYTPEVIVIYAQDFLIVHFQHLWFPWQQHKQNCKWCTLWCRNRLHYSVLYFNDTSFTLHKVSPKEMYSLPCPGGHRTNIQQCWVKISYTEYHTIRWQMWEVWTEIHLQHHFRYSYHYTEFHEIFYYSLVSCEDTTHQISPKSANKYGKYRYEYIFTSTYSMIITKPVFMKL